MLIFESLKEDITSYPVIDLFDSAKPFFIKIYFSYRAILFILMQPDNNTASTKALINLQDNVLKLFNATIDGPRLQPIISGYRLYTITHLKLNLFAHIGNDNVFVTFSI